MCSSLLMNAKVGLGFYLKMGFIQFKDDPMRLFLPMTTVEQLF